MGKGNGSRQAGQNQSFQKTGRERDGKKINTATSEIDEILSAYNFMKAEGLFEIEFDSDPPQRTKIYIKRKIEVPASGIKHIQEEEFPDAISIKSPLSGIFHTSPKHGELPFVILGDIVEEGKTLCIIEAMKVMNEIKSDSKYKIIKILAANGKSVSAGEVLFLAKPV